MERASGAIMGVHEHCAPPTIPEEEPGTSVRRLSKTLWDVDWSLLLPQSVTDDGVSVEWSCFERAAPFVRAHYAEIFEEAGGSPFDTRLEDAKTRYYRAVGDFFEFVHEGRTVGLLIGTPIDWSSYYIRSAAALPAYQGRKIVQRFFPLLFAQLKAAGVERIEADTSPANMATIQLLTRLRFNVTGTLLSERWGATLHLTKFLHEESENVFLRQFCSGVKYQLRERTRAVSRHANWAHPSPNQKGASR
jgi:ribosomal protein S18 acetylase RimI-like enzyme